VKSGIHINYDCISFDILKAPVLGFIHSFSLICSFLSEQNRIIISMEKYERPTWDEYFSRMVDAVAQRATCDRGRAGCVIVKEKQILVTGYVGSPKGLPHCDDVGHLFKKVIHSDGKQTQHCVRTVHAEQNAITQAARRGISLEGSTLYVRMTPCRTCSMLIINTGIERVVCQKKYHAANESEDMLKEAGIRLDYLSEELLEYEGQ
jgi:dCMP deaminase